MTQLIFLLTSIQEILSYSGMLNWVIVLSIQLTLIMALVRLFRKPLERTASTHVLLRLLAIFGVVHVIINPNMRNLFDVRMLYNMFTGKEYRALFQLSLPVYIPSQIAELPSAGTIDWLFIFTWIWLAGVAALTVRNCVRKRSAKQRLKQEAQSCPGNVQTQFDAIMQEDAYSAYDVKLVYQPGIASPCTYLSYLMSKFTIALDRVDYAPEELDMILRHELSHIKLRHPDILFFLEFISVLCWFNPLLILMKKWMRQQMELETDAEVLKRRKATKEQRVTYARLLVSLAEEKQLSGAVLYLSASAEFVRQRTLEILSPTSRRFGWLITLLLVALGLQFSLVLAPGENRSYTAAELAMRLGNRQKVSISNLDPILRTSDSRAEVRLNDYRAQIYAHAGWTDQITCWHMYHTPELKASGDGFREECVRQLTEAIGAEPEVTEEKLGTPSEKREYRWEVTLSESAWHAMFEQLRGQPAEAPVQFEHDSPVESGEEFTGKAHLVLNWSVFLEDHFEEAFYLTMQLRR